MIRLRGLLLPALFILAAPALPVSWDVPGGARAQEVQVEATSVQHDRENNIYRYEDARVQIGGLTLHAQQIEIHPAAGRLFATGQVRFREGSLAGTAQRVEMDIEKNTVTLTEANLFDSANGYYLTARKIFRPEEGRYIASDCTLTSCSPKEGGWKLLAGELDYRVDDFATGTNVVLKVGPVPVFYFPWFAWPTVDQRHSGFLAPRLSFESSSLPRFDLGTRLKAPFFWALGVDHDVTITPDYMSNRGVAADLDYRYAFWDDQVGSLRFFGIEEAFARDPADENVLPGVPTGGDFKPSRHLLDWNHNQGFGDSQRLILTLNQSSDGQVRREYLGVSEYRPHQEYQGTYSALGSWAGVAVMGEQTSEFVQESVFADNGSLADGRFRPRQLPRLAFSAGGQPFAASRLGLELSGNLTRFTTDDALSGQVREVRPAIVYPLRLGGSWELRSSLARRFVQYEQLTERLGADETEIDPRSFAQNEVEIELRASFARVFVDEGKEGGALKHRITPRLIFFELEDVRQPLAGSFCLVDQANVPQPPAENFCLVDQAEPNNIVAEDDLKAGLLQPTFSQRLLTLRLDNTWLVRTGGGVQERGHLNFIQPYNLLFADADFVPKGLTPDPAELESAPGEPLMPIVIEGGINVGGLSATTELRYHHQRSRITSRAVSLSGAVSPRANMSVAYNQNLFSFRTPDNKLHGEGARLRFSGNINATPSVGVGYSGVVNLRDATAPLDRRLESTRLYLDYHPGCCTVRVSYSEDLKVTSVNGVREHFVDRKVLITFTLGGLISVETTASSFAGGL